MLSDKFKFPATFDAKLVDQIDHVVQNRPSPIRTYDQIYMFESDMLQQTLLLLDYVKNKKIAFLGDGDGISSLLYLFSKNERIPIKQTTVFDFDQRILNNYKNFIEKQEISNADTVLYNVLEPVPVEYHNKYNFFYINPPYGSRNNGLSCIAWLHRCLSLCSADCSGFIVIPYDKERSWTVSSMSNIQAFLIEKGFVIRDMISEFHNYHLEDDPELRSATIVVDRFNYCESEYRDCLLPQMFANYLYGSPRRLPKYIFDDDTKYGFPDYQWIYGKEFEDHS